MVALAILVEPNGGVVRAIPQNALALHRNPVQHTRHKNAGILLQGDKDNYRAMLVALQGVTAAPVSVAEKEREFLPVGLTTKVSPGSQEATSAGKTEPSEATAP